MNLPIQDKALFFKTSPHDAYMYHELLARQPAFFAQQYK